MSCNLKTVALFLQIITNVLLSRPFGNIVYLLLKHRTIPLNSLVFPMVKTQSEPGHMYKYQPTTFQMNTLHGATVFHLHCTQIPASNIQLITSKKRLTSEAKSRISNQPLFSPTFQSALCITISRDVLIHIQKYKNVICDNYLKGFQKPYLESDSLTREQVDG